MSNTVELIGVEEALKKFDPQIVSKATTAALNKVGSQAFTAASKEIRSEYNIKAKDLKKAFEFKKARGSVWLAEIQAKGKGTPLIYFSAKQTKKGVTARVLKAKGRKTYPSRFIATMKSGYKGVFVREGKKRLPIKQEFRVGIATAFGSKKIMDITRKVIADKWGSVFKNAMDFYMGKARTTFERVD
jgi:hypothetical protein